MYTYIISRDKNEITRIKDQLTDFCVLKYFIDKTSYSMNHALKHEGYSVKVLNQETNEICNY